MNTLTFLADGMVVLGTIALALLVNIRTYPQKSNVVHDTVIIEPSFINEAISKCFDSGGGVVLIPSGHYIFKDLPYV